MKIGNLVRFNHERDGGPVHKVVSVMADGMIELHDMGGYFAPHLFVVADDIAAIPTTPEDQAATIAELRAEVQQWKECAESSTNCWVHRGKEYEKAEARATAAERALVERDAKLAALRIEFDRWCRADQAQDTPALLRFIAEMVSASIPAPEPGSEYVIVPKEPTEAMLDAGHEADKDGDRGNATDIWQAMIAARAVMGEPEGG